MGIPSTTTTNSNRLGNLSVHNCARWRYAVLTVAAGILGVDGLQLQEKIQLQEKTVCSGCFDDPLDCKNIKDQEECDGPNNPLCQWEKNHFSSSKCQVAETVCKDFSMEDCNNEGNMNTHFCRWWTPLPVNPTGRVAVCAVDKKMVAEEQAKQKKEKDAAATGS